MNKYVAIALIVALLTLSASGAWVAHRISVMTRKGEELTATVQQTMDRGYSYFDWQLTDFQSPAYQKRLEASVATGAYIGSMANSFNRLVIPEMRDTFRALREKNLVSLDTLTMSLNDFVSKDMSGLVSNLDQQINRGLLPGLTAALATLDLSIHDLDEQVIGQSGLSLKQFNALLTDEKIDKFLKSLVAMGENGVRATDELASLTGSAESLVEEKIPEIVDLWAKAMKTANKFQKWIYLARILSLLGPLVPWQ